MLIIKQCCLLKGSAVYIVLYVVLICVCLISNTILSCFKKIYLILAELSLLVFFKKVQTSLYTARQDIRRVIVYKWAKLEEMFLIRVLRMCMSKPRGKAYP